MAQVYGELREDIATYGEKRVLKLLIQNLPKEYCVYIECPLPGKRLHRYPDFIVVTNYGVIILEVKDWIQILRADRYGAEIVMRGNQRRKVANPVNQARESALLLADELGGIKEAFNYKKQLFIPWGYAVVLPNLPTSTITRLRQAWGEEFVLNTDDLDPPLILSRLKVTLPKDRIRDLRKYELDFIRATINPTVLIEPQGRPPIILDDEQEHIVSEPVKVVETPVKTEQPSATQQDLFVESKPPELELPATPDYEDRISKNTSIRLVRGIAGSGKTLVLAQRAKYLAAKYPEWKICVITYNNQLEGHFKGLFKGIKNIETSTFHSLCGSLLRSITSWKKIDDPGKFLDTNKFKFPVIRKFRPEYIEEEIKWIKDIGISDRQQYLEIIRKGRGQDKRLTRKDREDIYDVMMDYQSFNEQNEYLDWADMPNLVVNGFERRKIKSPNYDAILIDEAQDFAPAWMKVISYIIHPDRGLLFLADDPAQSLYRFFSWREKGVNVVGRTRWLKIPYRNTYEIYQAAYQLIASDPTLQKSMQDEGILVVPELSNSSMRHGPKPIITRYENFDSEINAIRSRINEMISEGIEPKKIAVLHRRRRKIIGRLSKEFSNLGVNVNTFHAYKGLEFDCVFLCQLQETLVRGGNEDDVSGERRLIYMAMTRARENLYMGYENILPNKFKCMFDFVEINN